MGLMNQTPTRNQNPIQNNQLIQIRKGGFDESNPYVRKTKSIQFIDIFKKVGLINQAPTNFLLLFNH